MVLPSCPLPPPPQRPLTLLLLGPLQTGQERGSLARRQNLLLEEQNLRFVMLPGQEGFYEASKIPVSSKVKLNSRHILIFNGFSAM